MLCAFYSKCSTRNEWQVLSADPSVKQLVKGPLLMPTLLALASGYCMQHVQLHLQVQGGQDHVGTLKPAAHSGGDCSTAASSRANSSSADKSNSSSGAASSASSMLPVCSSSSSVQRVSCCRVLTCWHYQLLLQLGCSSHYSMPARLLSSSGCSSGILPPGSRSCHRYMTSCPLLSILLAVAPSKAAAAADLAATQQESQRPEQLRAWCEWLLQRQTGEQLSHRRKQQQQQ
jgi:hypothetical protein